MVKHAAAVAKELCVCRAGAVALAPPHSQPLHCAGPRAHAVGALPWLAEGLRQF